VKPGTQVVRAGLPDATQGEPILPGPVFAAVYHLRGDPATTPYGYGRFNNPTWAHYEQALSELEGGTALLYPSGMAAISGLVAAILKTGDTIVLPSDGYYTFRTFARDYLVPNGIEIRQVPTRDMPDTDAVRGATLVLIETPSNPGMDVCDIEAVARAVHAAGGLLAVDNTTATPLGQQPLALGADFAVMSDTKAMTGHGDLLLGHVAARDNDHAARLRDHRTRSGAIPGPMEVWLAHRSLPTLELRLGRMSTNAHAIAEFLAAQPAVQRVRYPGLHDDPSHEIALRQMRYFGPVLSFVLHDRAAAERFLSASELITESTSFGGVHTTAERRGRWGGDAIEEGFIRLSAGCEDISDLLADIDRALHA